MWMPPRFVPWCRLRTATLVLAQCAVFALLGRSVLAQEPATPPANAEAVPTESAPSAVTVDRSSPRATVRSFLVAVQEAIREKPARIDDAVSCLDVSRIEGEDAPAQARRLARRLYAAMDKIGVKVGDVPAETLETDHTLYRVDPNDDSSAGIDLTWDAQSQAWRFTASTLDAIAVIETKLAEQAASAVDVPAASEVASARRSARATMRTFLTAMNADPQQLRQAVLCLDPAGQDAASWEVRARDLVVKLKNVMDKTRLVVEVNLPDTPVGEPFVWESSADGNVVLARIEDAVAYEKDWEFAPKPGEWRFTPETVRAIPALYRAKEREAIKEEVRQTGVEERLSVGLWLEQRVPVSLRREFLSLAIWKWLALACVLLLGWPVDALVAALVGLVFGGWLRRKRITMDRDVRRRAFRSTGAAGAALFWWHVIGADYLVLGEWISVLLPLTKVITGVTTVWVSYRLVDVLGGYVAANRDVQLTQFDDVLIPLVTKVLRVVVVFVTMVLVFELMGIKPTTVLGVMGVGGVAVAFAAQDTIGNFFGSITVLLDRPFGIGDWIAIGDVEGTVERVGFRSTRVRTFYNSVITIPNSQMVNTQVDNYGARRYRRVKILLSVTYDTPPEKIDAFCEGIRELILLHPFTRKDYYHVYFNQFAGSSLDVLLYAFFEVPDWSTELRERHHLLMDILRLGRRLEVSFAFPTQTVHLERAPAKSAAEPRLAEGDPGAVGVDQAAAVYQGGYGAAPGPPAPVVIPTKPRSHRHDD